VKRKRGMKEGVCKREIFFFLIDDEKIALFAA